MTERNEQACRVCGSERAKAQEGQVLVSRGEREEDKKAKGSQRKGDKGKKGG